MDKITCGKILRAQGLSGEIKVKAYTDDITRFDRLEYVFIGADRYYLTSARYANGFVYLKLNGINTRNAADALRDKPLLIPKSFLASLDEGEYYISDVIGCKLLTGDGETVGVISDIQNYGSADVYTINCEDGRIMRFPFLKKIIISVDIDSRSVSVDKKGLEEVCVYED